MFKHYRCPSWVVNGCSPQFSQRPLCADCCLSRIDSQRLFWRKQTLRLHDPESQMCPTETLVALKREAIFGQFLSFI
jgi:hypothetical protein